MCRNRHILRLPCGACRIHLTPHGHWARFSNPESQALVARIVRYSSFPLFNPFTRLAPADLISEGHSAASPGEHFAHFNDSRHRNLSHLPTEPIRTRQRQMPALQPFPGHFLFRTAVFIPFRISHFTNDGNTNRSWHTNSKTEVPVRHNPIRSGVFNGNSPNLSVTR